VVNAASAYFAWAVAIPFAGMAAFVWDGVYIGITATRRMLWSSVLSSLVFFGVWQAFFSLWGNHALWLAFILYLMVRGILQTWYYCKGKL
jgi:MATE family multidrug resistance protein